jgi:SAM-dependent methyltransferase
VDAELFAREDAKYSHLWAHGYRSARWRILARRLLRRAATLEPKPRILDLGAGKGDALAYFRKRGFLAAGVDISAYAVDRLRARGHEAHQAALDDLSVFPDGAFEVGYSNDVLEHLPEPLVDASLAEMARVCSRYLYLSVCPTPSENLSREGENLHLTVRPKAWWEERLARIGTVREYRIWFNRSLRYEIELPGARTPR